ncbi:MAG TPA: excinuclease ABC subunit A, partial [Flavobacteriales bacterium]|nr:excinuclease ABC subunit A [Flavobacteriales bacterium]
DEDNRIKINEEIHGVEEYLQKPDLKKVKSLDVSVIIDRIIVTSVDDEENINRLSDSVLTAFYEGEGVCCLDVFNTDRKNHKTISFSNKFELDGITFEKPVEHFFSFNNPFGACSECEGFGSIIGIDSNLVVPNKSLSVYEEAIACWKGEKMKRWKDRLINNAAEFEFPIHRPFSELSEQERDLLWTGNKYFKGLNDFFKYIEKKSYKIQYRVMLSRYRGKTKCPKCRGTRIRPDASFVKINDHSITDLLVMPASKLLHFFEDIKLNSFDKKVGERLLLEIITRLKVLCDVGLDYLTLNRSTNTLSGGESQRINLSSSLGSSLVGSMYILDEPSVGLHPRDTARLIKVLLSLKDIGNTVIVVEHDEDIMKVADQIIDLGLYAGSDGGNIIFQGDHNAISRDKKSITACYLNGTLSIDVPSKRRSWTDHIKIEGASENNLNHIDARFPLGAMTVVTGVSGSGKSSLVKNILFPAVDKFLGGYGKKIGDYKSISGSLEMISSVEFVDQNPIGKSSRSNPVTYVKAYDDIRRLFADQQISIQMGFKPSHFSFNVDGGRCEECEGEGKIKVEMQFMADIQLLCDSCKGNRFKKEILSVRYQDKNIAGILNLTIDEAIQFFTKNEGVYERSIVRKLMPLRDVGMGYIKMGQPSSTLSGGEAQRIKLATFLGIKKTDTQKNVLFIFDEPTTGLHFHDIKKLLQSFNALINQGHSIVIIEHNLEVVKNADWIIDLGPEGGDEGGNLVFEGIPEEIINEPKSYTGRYLAKKL